MKDFGGPVNDWSTRAYNRNKIKVENEVVNGVRRAYQTRND